MTPERQQFDRWLMRGKDVIIIVAAFLSFVGYGFKLYTLPAIQEAQAKLLETIQLKIIAHDQELATLRVGISDIKELLLKK